LVFIISIYIKTDPALNKITKQINKKVRGPKRDTTEPNKKSN